MDGPDLSHLLDASAEQPSPDVLVGIVRRHRRLKARRARAAATLGLVIVVAGAGVGVGLSRRGGGTMTALPKTSRTNMSNGLATLTPSPSTAGSAPAGLGWVNAGAGTGSTTNLALPMTAAAVSGTKLQVTSAYATAGGRSLCSIWNCSLYSPYGSMGGARLQRQFNRTSDGVTVRAFTASWAVAPLELVPTAPSSATEHGSHSFRASAAGQLCGHPGPCRRSVRCRFRRRRHRAARTVAGAAGQRPGGPSGRCGGALAGRGRGRARDNPHLCGARSSFEGAARTR